MVFSENRRLSLACRQNQLEASNADPINLLSLKLKQAIGIKTKLLVALYKLLEFNTVA